MKVALYCRVSTDEQAKHGLSIDTQLDNLRDWAKGEGHTIVGEYIDAGISGKKPLSKRPQLLQFMRDMDGGLAVDILAFTKLDRFFRSVKHYYETVTLMEKHNVAWTAIQEDYETISSAGRFKTNIMLSVAEAEADRTSERIKTVMDRKLVKGEYLGGNIPIGYKRDGKRLVIDQDSAPIIKECFDTIIRTGCIGEVVEYLHSQGYMRYHSTVSSLLRNEVYTGYHKGNPSYCPAIIDRQTFLTAQASINSTPARKNHTGRVYLFSGLVFCGKCGNHMAGQYRPKYAEGRRYAYRCNRSQISHMCDMSTVVSEHDIVDYLLAKLEKEVLSISAPVVKKKPKRAEDNSKKLDRLNELYVEGMIDKETYLSKRKLLTSTEMQKDTHADYSVIKQLLIKGNLREQYHSLTRAEQKELWRSILQRIEIAGRDISITFLP